MAYLTAILALILALAGGWWWTDSTGFDRGYKDRDGSCTTEKLEIENAKLEAERQANAERDKGRILADRAAERVAKLQADLADNSERFNRELNRRASATRVCFSPPVARLLNGPGPVPASNGDSASAAAARTAPDSAPAAPDAPRPDADDAGTSERAAGAYIDLIKARFEACRVQLREVILSTKNEPID
jgi:hypothetical protein